MLAPPNLPHKANKPTDQAEIISTRKAVRQLVRKNFPIFLAEAFITFSVSGILMTMLATSWIIFGENEPFHALEMSLIVSARTWAVAGAGLLFGILADRFPRKPIFVIILILAGLGRLLNGFAPEDPWIRYGMFIFCNIIVGVGQGGLQPAATSYADDAVDVTMRSRFFGVYEIFRQCFQILGMVLCAWMFQIGLWREYFWITGVMLFICAFMVVFVIKEPKRGSQQNSLKSVLANDNIHYRYKLNKETIRKTVLSPTNIITFFEGIFTWIIFSISMFLLYPYIQSPPYNISPLVTSVMMIIFGIPGAIIGSIIFSRMSDRLANKDIFYRINLIIFSIVVLFFSVLIIFLVPLPQLTVEQGNDIRTFLGNYGLIGIGLLLFMIRAVLGLYHINQTPIIQKINLPEAQGTVSAWNQFLETIGMGLGPLIAGLLLTYNQDYFMTALISLLIGLPSTFLWLLTKRYIHKDIQDIEIILQERAKYLAETNKIEKN